MERCLLPHGGGLKETVAEGYRLNQSLRVLEVQPRLGRGGWEGSSLMQVEPISIVMVTIKQAEDGRGVIVRLYQGQPRRGPERTPRTE